ncbi:ATP-binding protein [Acholeplasma equirhinis]|uniref:ATP-binding protein n=1 Tax=Acholeplasma equirhinis TaxID=555393 RepID=UPI00197AEE2F|nr:ATP-binding protein [Acholeplasma equirhinis]MBN3490663.1 ATP-binding protein [Acholeplasma equirhinis]
MDLTEVKLIVQSDPETKDLNLNESDLLIAYQYILQKQNNTLKGFIPKLVLKPYLHIAYVPTKEKLNEEVTNKLKANLEVFESDTYIADANLNDFIVDDEQHEKAMKFVDEFLKEPKKFQRGLYLYGPYGTGKSYFLQGLAKELTKRFVNVVYTFVPDLTRSLKASMGTPDLEKKLNLLKRCDVLILDDLGGENITQWFRDEVLLPVLHYRLSAELTVFVSSNYDLKQLAQMMQLNNEDMTIQSARIIKRIQTLTKTLKFDKRFKND